MTPKLIEWMTDHPRLAVLALVTWRLSWFIALLCALGLFGAGLALGVFGVGGHDLAGRVSLGALTGSAAIMMFALGSLARLSAGQLKAAMIARRCEAPALFRRLAPCR